MKSATDHFEFVELGFMLRWGRLRMVFPPVLSGMDPLVLGHSLLLRHDFPGVSVESSRCLPYLSRLSGLKHQIVSSKGSAANTFGQLSSTSCFLLEF